MGSALRHASPASCQPACDPGNRQAFTAGMSAPLTASHASAGRPPAPQIPVSIRPTGPCSKLVPSTKSMCVCICPGQQNNGSNQIAVGASSCKGCPEIAWMPVCWTERCTRHWPCSGSFLAEPVDSQALQRRLLALKQSLHEAHVGSHLQWPKHRSRSASSSHEHNSVPVIH